MRQVPKLPLRHFRAPRRVLRKQAPLGTQAGQVLENGVCLEQPEPVVIQRRQLAVRVYGEVFGAALLAFAEVDDPPFVLEVEIGRRRKHLEGARRRGKHAERERHGRSSPGDPVGRRFRRPRQDVTYHPANRTAADSAVACRRAGAAGLSEPPRPRDGKSGC